MDAEGLKSVPLFASLDDTARRKFAVWVGELSVSEGKHLVDEGDYAYDLFIIQEGTAAVRHGDEHVAELGPGDFFGEIGVLEKDLRTATVKAKSDMRLVTLTGWDMKRMEKSIPQAAERVREVLESRRPEG